MDRFLIVCLGGAVGSGLRYLVTQGSREWLGTSFPYGTLFVNLAGCFLIALVMYLAVEIATFPESLRLGLTTGFIGGLTTYSTFNYETTALLRDGATRVAILNLGATTLGCFAAGLLGLLLARAIVS